MASVENMTASGGPARTATLVAASLGFAVIQLDVTVVNVAVKQIGDQLGGGVSGLQWMVSSYTLMFAALILSAGTLADRFGAKRIFSVGFVVFVVASVACGAAPDIGVLLVSRAVEGIGAALLGACSLVLIHHAFEAPAAHARAVARWAAGGTTALSGGPVIGGLLISTLGWRAIFFINVPIGAVGLWLTRRYAHETPVAADRGLDPAGQLTAVVALAALATALIQGGSSGFGTGLVATMAVVFGVAAVAFLVVERTSKAPMLPLGLFRRRRVRGPVAIGLLVNVCFYGLVFVFSLMFQTEDGYSALRTGLAFLPMTAIMLVSNLLTARIAARLGAAVTILGGAVVMLIGCLGLLGTTASTPYVEIGPQQVLLGAGLGLLVPPLTGAMLSSVDRSRSGVASGVFTALRQSGSLLGVALFGSLIAAPGDFFAGLHVALGVSAVVLVASAALTRLLTAA